MSFFSGIRNQMSSMLEAMELERVRTSSVPVTVRPAVESWPEPLPLEPPASKPLPPVAIVEYVEAWQGPRGAPIEELVPLPPRPLVPPVEPSYVTPGAPAAGTGTALVPANTVAVLPAPAAGATTRVLLEQQPAERGAWPIIVGALLLFLLLR